MKMLVSYRQAGLALFLIPLALLGFGYYLEFVQGLEPCPLCVTQRVCFYLVAAFAFAGLFKYRSVLYQRICNALAAFSALTGLLVAGRQLWLQSLPEDRVPACGPDLAYMLNNFPLTEALAIMFKGDGNCAEIDWTFLGLSIAGWSFVAFAGLLVLAAFQFWRGAAK